MELVSTAVYPLVGLLCPDGARQFSRDYLLLADRDQVTLAHLSETSGAALVQHVLRRGVFRYDRLAFGNTRRVLWSLSDDKHTLVRSEYIVR
jgi:hypothetical protein